MIKTSNLSIFKAIMIALAIILVGIPLMLFVIQAISGSSPDFAKISGGPQVVDKNFITPFKVELNFASFFGAKDRINMYIPGFMPRIVGAVIGILFWLVVVVMDDKENALGNGAGADWAAIVAKMFIPLIFLIGTPILGLAISIATTMMILRDRDQQQKGLVTLIIVGVVAILVMTTGNRYLLLTPTGVIGWYRMVLHILFSIEKGNAIWIMEAIDLIAFFYLMSQPQTDASGQAWKFALGGFMAVVLGMVPFSTIWIGEMFLTKTVKNYVIYRFVVSGLLIIKEIGMSSSGSKGDGSGKYLSTQHNIMSLFWIGIIYVLTYAGRVGLPAIFPKLIFLGKLASIAPVFWLMLAIFIVAGIEGRSSATARPISSNVGQDDHQNLDPLGGFFTIGAFRFWNAVLEVIAFAVTVSSLFWPGFVQSFFHL